MHFPELKSQKYDNILKDIVSVLDQKYWSYQDFYNWADFYNELQNIKSQFFENYWNKTTKNKLALLFYMLDENYISKTVPQDFWVWPIFEENQDYTNLRKDFLSTLIAFWVDKKILKLFENIGYIYLQSWEYKIY